MERAGSIASDVELEITERTLIVESGPGASALGSLRALGVGLAIDDFGTGYSSWPISGGFPSIASDAPVEPTRGRGVRNVAASGLFYGESAGTYLGVPDVFVRRLVPQKHR